ncbi:MAG: Fur family transcriptional regulator [Bryobacteraceae bacterium]
MNREPISYLDFRRLCYERGLSVTHQRHIIYNALAEMHDHPSPEAVHERVKAQIPSISAATVYKNIHTFMEHGLVREVSLHRLQIETNIAPHHHLVCSQCRAILDLPGDFVEPVRILKRMPKGYRIDHHAVEFTGLCPACSSNL